MALTCPITKNLIIEPVSAPDGFTYEKKELLKYIRRFKKSPITGEPMNDKTLIFFGEKNENKELSEIELDNVRKELELLIDLRSNENNLENFPCQIKARFQYHKSKKEKNSFKENKNFFFSCILTSDDKNSPIQKDLLKSIQYSMNNFHFTLFDDEKKLVYTARCLKNGKFKVNYANELCSFINKKKSAFINKWSSFTKEASAKWWLDGITTDEITSSPLRSLLRLKENSSLIKQPLNMVTDLENLNTNQKEVFHDFKELSIVEGPPGTGKTTVISKLLEFTKNNCHNFALDSGNVDPENHISIILSEKNRGVEAVAERLTKDHFDTTIAFGSDSIGLKTAEFLVHNKILKHPTFQNMEQKLQDIYIDCNSKIKKIKRLLFSLYSRSILNSFGFETFQTVQFYVYNMKNGNKKIKSIKLCKDVEELINNYNQLINERNLVYMDIEKKFYKNCDTILVTFGSLHNVLSFLKDTKKTFSIIIDESSTLLSWQGFYLEYLIHELNAKLINLVLIGDTKQLPPYWINQDDPSYEHPSFLDLAKKFNNSIKLQIQYRLPVGIMNILNKNFYVDNPLILGNNNEDKKECIAWMHVDGVEEETNIDEINYIIKTLSPIPDSESIIIASPYRSQCDLIRDICADVLPRAVVMTLDQCQGHEADFVAVSLVKKNPTNFLSDKRTCVLISRAKKQLIMFGNRQNYLCCKNSSLRIISRFPGNLKFKRRNQNNR